MPAPSRGAWVFYNVTQAFSFWPKLDSILISQELPDMTATLSCRVVDPDSDLVFAVEDQVRVTFAGERIWAGHLKAVTEDREEETGPRAWDLEGQDYTAKLSDALITRRKKRKKEKALRRVRWLLRQLDRRVWTLAGKDLSHIPDEYVEAYDYFGDMVDEGLAHVADELRMHYYIDLDNRFQMYRTDAVAAPFDLDNDAPDYATTFPFRDWRSTDDSVDLGNAVLVEPEKRKHSTWSKDATSIAAYGRQERFISDSNIHRKPQARATGNRTLADTKDPETEATLLVFEPGLWAGMKVHVTEALWGHDYQRYVRAVQIRAVDTHDADGKAYLFTEATVGPMWRKKRRPARHGVNKNARRRPGSVNDVDLHTLDDFSRVVAPPSWEAGDSIPATVTKYGLNTVFIRDGMWPGVPYPGTAVLYESGPTTTGPFPSLSISALQRVGSYIGATATPWTRKPLESECGGYSFWYAGWEVHEVWFQFTIPAHPGSMAGITVTWSGALGVGSGVAATKGLLVVAGGAPIEPGQVGTVVGELPVGGSGSAFIPAALIPAEGSTLWVGLRPSWSANYGAEYCGWQWPRFNGVENSGYHASTPWLSGKAWAVWTVTGESIGTTTVLDDGPWEGGNAWRDMGTEGSPVYGVDGSALYVTGNGGHGWGVLGEREDDDEPWGPWSDVSWGTVIEFEKDADGSAGTASIEIATTGEGEKVIGTVHLGDGTYAEGISVAAPTTTEYAAFAMATGTRYAARFDSRSGKMRGKVWAVTDREPTEWNVEVPMAETEDDADRFTVWIRARAGQTIRALRIQAQDDARDGRKVEREWLGVSDGTTNRFPTAHPYRKGTLVAFVNGVRTPPSKEDGDGAQFWLDAVPTAGMTIRASYVADQGG